MKINFLYNLFILYKLTFKNYSLLRIIQVIFVKDLNVEGASLDVGSKKSTNNVTNYLRNTNLTYLDKFSKDKNDLCIDLEKFPNSFSDKKYKHVFLFNVLEHIKNYDNCLKNIYNFLEKDGIFYGSTPFLFKIHPSPNDYFRYTKQLLQISLESNGFKNIKIQVIGFGLFTCVYNLTFELFKKIPGLNSIFLTICLVLDKLVFFFTKNYKEIYPIGYIFTAAK
jgi:hypothetical protein